LRDLDTVLGAFFTATGCRAAVWTQAAPEGPIVVEAGDAPAVELPRLDSSGEPTIVQTDGGPAIVCNIPGSRRAWLVMGSCENESDLRRYCAFLQPVVSQFMQSAMEVEHAARELAERYEEINLLYTISEILGRTLTLEDAANTILTEIAETVGARRGAILVHDRVTDTLQCSAATGASRDDIPPIAANDDLSVSARVFRTQHPLIVEPEFMPSDAENAYRRGMMLSVPIMWTTPQGGEPLGVVNLSDRRSRQPFSAGDQKLVAAIATQIGTAIQNARLVRSSLNQQRLVHEMELAHELQMRLLPSVSLVAPEAEVAARVVPAESVGGDYYNLVRLDKNRTGVMVGDVSGHGYRAALIMALALSASTIHAQRIADPGEALAALLDSLRDELVTTEMFITTFYGVLDRKAKTLRYTNAGHPHAFVITEKGDTERLAAMDPPLGMVDAPPRGVVRQWTSGSDLLLLFTDGLSDARNRQGRRLGEEAVVESVVRHRGASPQTILDRTFELVQTHTGDVPLRDDQTMVVVRG
jgi:sigma-B regulation protein RsbU (phosphoserine phosphatase)